MSQHDEPVEIRRAAPGPRPEDWRHGERDPLAAEGFPERMAELARRAEQELREGRATSAIDVLDGMGAEIESWRRAAAESANQLD
ncbi:hypothetical protein B0I33_101161 [Prauserella shujinwangii]|uniref:Uncharacterized protein n=1 Tax=Prauserella shujinwangii TaxID=1453103 RepID=A0A2T0M2S1_9PSEU|nr:hypothetical protein [Prauserella shujinwangii]PRX51009.1 hypothetical protein B0I33_101161 [Prauserella shujinwangii]